MASKNFKYSLPIIEGYTGEEVFHNLSLPRFVTFKFPDYFFAPNTVNDVGITTIRG
jgi:hypothetical protein